MRLKIWLTMALSAASLAAWAQNAPTPPGSGAAEQNPNPNRVVISRGSSVAEAVASMAKAADATVAVDPALTGRVSEATSKLSLEPGLTAIAKQFRAQWRKVYLADNEIPRAADGRVDVRRLARLVEAASAAPPVTVGVVDPTTGQMTVTSRAAESAPAMQAWAKGRKPIYLLYLPGATAADAPPAGLPDSTKDMLPPGGMDAFRKMTPEQRRQWMQDTGNTVITSDMSPEERASLLQNLPPDERKRIEDRMNSGEGNKVMIFRHEERTETQPG